MLQCRTQKMCSLSAAGISFSLVCYTPKSYLEASSKWWRLLPCSYHTSWSSGFKVLQWCRWQLRMQMTRPMGTAPGWSTASCRVNHTSQWSHKQASHSKSLITVSNVFYCLNIDSVSVFVKVGLPCSNTLFMLCWRVLPTARQILLSGNTYFVPDLLAKQTAREKSC